MLTIQKWLGWIGISGKAENFTALAMRARELKLKKDLGDIQGHGSNFKASQSSGMHILIILNQERKSQS